MHTQTTGRIHFGTNYFILSIRCEKLTNEYLFQYEMVFVYIWSKLLKPMTTSFDKDPIDDDERTKRLQAFIKRAIDFLNRKAGTTLSFNYPIHAHHTTQKFNEWIGIDEDLQHHKFNDSVICILDDDSDDDDLESIRKTGSELIGGKVEIQPIADREWTLTHHNNSFCVCCMDYNKLFAECFAGTNFDLNLNLKSMENDPFVKCLLCCEMAGRDSLNAHFDNACSLFRAWAELIVICSFDLWLFKFLYI